VSEARGAGPRHAGGAPDSPSGAVERLVAPPPGALHAAPDGNEISTSSSLLTVQGLCKRFGKRSALHEVSFHAQAGERIAVIGPNGAGKTTLLSILAGVQRPTSGEVSHPARELGWVPQQPALYSKLSVVENLRLFARLERVQDPEAAVQRMLAQTGLAERACERVENLSGGNRQRVNVALGLLADPPAVLLDEPSSALDPDQRQRLWTFVAELARRGTCVLFSTHIVSEAARYAERVLVLDEGRLLFDGPPGELAGAAAPEAQASGEEDFERAFVAFLRERANG
jgi:ABC-2 type transport system ATP-binding protein